MVIKCSHIPRLQFIAVGITSECESYVKCCVTHMRVQTSRKSFVYFWEREEAAYMYQHNSKESKWYGLLILSLFDSLQLC